MSSNIEKNAMYMVAYFRSYPPGDPFHWGLFVQTNESSERGTLFHAIQNPSWVYQTKLHSVHHSQNAVIAAKIGSVPPGTLDQAINALLEGVPVGKSHNYAGEWRC